MLLFMTLRILVVDKLSWTCKAINHIRCVYETDVSRTISVPNIRDLRNVGFV
jgi:hypothetical protein